MRKIIATVVFTIGALIAALAIAAQSSLFSPTTGTVSGLSLTNNYNSALDSLNTCNSGTSAPTNQLSGSPSKGNCWMDTSVAGQATVKYYDGANWVVVGILDTTNHIWQGVMGGGIFTYAAASGGTADICGVAPYIVEIGGSTNLSSFGSGTGCTVGQFKLVNITGGFTIVNSATLVLPGGANIVAQSGDLMFAFYIGSSTFVVVGYTPANVATCPTGTPSSSFATRAGFVTHC